MQSPKVGRIVLFKSMDRKETSDHGNDGEVPAIITRVFSETCVNLKVLRDGEVDRWFTSVVRDQVGGRSWRWPDITAPMARPQVIT